MSDSTTARRLRPWEEKGVGVPVIGALLTEEALKISKHDWGVEKVSMMSAPQIRYLQDEETNEDARDADGNKIKDEVHSENSDLFGIINPCQVMTVRVDRDEDGIITNQSYLGTVGTNYKVVTNREAVAFFDEALGPDAACIVAVGTLGRFGARFFMIAKMPDMLEVVPGDPLERYILLTTTHDGTGNIEARFITFRESSFSMVHTPGEVVKIRHTKNAKLHLKTAYRVLSANEQWWDRAKRAYAYMAKRDVDTLRMREFLKAMFPDIQAKDDDGKPLFDDDGSPIMKTSPQAQKARDEIQELFEGAAPGAAVAGQTDWGLYNSVAYFVDHERRQGKKSREWKISRWETSVFGPGATLRERAYRWLMQNK